MTQAPGIKEALEAFVKAYRSQESSTKGLDDAYAMARAALTTLQPSGERREAIARILADPKHNERARFVQGFLYGDDYVIRDIARRENQELFRTKDEAAYEQRLEIERAKFAADAILASGLVQEETKGK